MKETIELLIDQMKKLYLYTNALDPIKDEIEQILDTNDFFDLDFVKKVLFCEEIKTNDLVEGYYDDLDLINEILKTKSAKKNGDGEKEQRILNLYNGYKYILKENKITKDTLKKLYDILSRNLLGEYDLNKMGEYYRKAPVYIYYSNNLDKLPDEGIDYKELEKYTSYLLDYINQDSSFSLMTDYYIKSQIIHFYFVFIHPYFDVNGRTSRTLSMWYLLNNRVYPFIIFNRGINYHKSIYYQAIREAKKYGNVTIFIRYMLESVKNELIKETKIQTILKNNIELTPIQRQTMNYILSMNGEKTLKDYWVFYSRFNKKMSLKEVNETMIQPLIEKDILKIKRYTKKSLYDGSSNFTLEINKNLLDEKIK